MPAHLSLAEEQNASIFGHKGKGDAKIDMPVIPDEHPTRYRSMPDTPNERLVTVLQEALDVAGSMDPYLTEMCSPASKPAEELGKATETADWGGLWSEGKTSELLRARDGQQRELACPTHSRHCHASPGTECSVVMCCMGAAVFRFSNVWTTDVVEAKTLAM